MATRDWNATSYDSISKPQQEWGAAVLERLRLNGDEVVLDAGCGTGRVTELLLERLPRGRVVAVDGSRSMAERARELLDPARVTVVCQDLLELELDERLDAAISTATFHHIFDHERLFARIRAVLRDGAQFVAQCGGIGNIERARAIGAELAAEPPYASTSRRSATSGITRPSRTRPGASKQPASTSATAGSSRSRPRRPGRANFSRP